MSKAFEIYVDRADGGVWLFDDVERSIYSEPFVGEINRMIDCMVSGCQAKITFSRKNFPGANIVLYKLRHDGEGAWYQASRGSLLLGSGWLCGVLKRYFHFRPKRIYVQIQEVT